jgi:hypothetical protein
LRARAEGCIPAEEFLRAVERRVQGEAETVVAARAIARLPAILRLAGSPPPLLSIDAPVGGLLVLERWAEFLPWGGDDTRVIKRWRANLKSLREYFQDHRGGTL